MEEYRDAYESNRVELVRNLPIHRTLLFNYLRSKNVLDKDDCELIQAEKTSERKAGKLLDLLGHKGKDGFECFTEALQLQSPELYKMLTGKDAGLTPNPIWRRYHQSRLGIEGGMDDVEMELLTEHLSNSYAELQRISCQYHTTVKEKRQLEGRLMMNEVELERQKSQSTAWQERFIQEKTCSFQKQNKAEKCVSIMVFENEQQLATIKSLETEIIQLKMKLLHSNGQENELKIKLNNANTKKDKETRYRQEMGESYENERKQAARLSLKIKCQEDELQVLDTHKRRCADLEFFKAELKTENEKLQEELDELTKWTNGLKDRYDMVENDNIRTRESTRNVSENIKALQDETKKLKQKSSHFEVENDFLKFRVTFLEKDCEIYKKQRDNAMISRNEAAQERDKVWREREQVWHHYIEIQKARDSEIEKRESCMGDLEVIENRFNETVSDLGKTKLKLNEARLLVEEMKVKINEQKNLEETHEQNSRESSTSAQENVNSDEISQETIQTHGKNSRQDLISSLRRRLNKTSEVDADYSSLQTRLSDRKSSMELLMFYFSDFDEEVDQGSPRASMTSLCGAKWTRSCPQLDDLCEEKAPNNDGARHSLTALPLPDLHLLPEVGARKSSPEDVVLGEAAVVTSPQYNNLEDHQEFKFDDGHPPRYKERLPVFRRRANGMSIHQPPVIRRKRKATELKKKNVTAEMSPTLPE